MPVIHDTVLYSVVREEHLVHSDFFLRYLEFPEVPARLVLTPCADGRPCCEIVYQGEELAARLDYSRRELARYRPGSIRRILGRDGLSENSFLHEYFSLFASAPVDSLHIQTVCGGQELASDVPVVPYESPNRWQFPLRGTVLVTDTYPSINSHRWCRNSEFAFDAGAFDETLQRPLIAGMPVYAACGGVVEEVFDGLEDTDGQTDLDALEARFGEHARIDGNHVLLRHPGGELSLYAHLQKGTVLVEAGQAVQAGQALGRVGSSGSSWTPHLHFHVMREGIEGPGVPVRFQGLTTLFGEPCLLEDTVNLVHAAL